MPRSWKDHYAEAERLLHRIETEEDLEVWYQQIILMKAQVHATMATAKAEPVPHRVPVRA